MMHAQRGTALAETGLVVGFSLVIIFNAIELGLLGYSQIHADAAAFVGARINATTGSTSTATTAVGNALPPAIAPTYATSGNNAVATVVDTVPGLLMVPGVAATIGVQGEHLEPIPNAALTAQPFQFAVPQANTFLSNYFWGSTQTTITTRTIYLAQAVVTTGTGNGTNGVFTEWQSHEKCFAGVNFPGSYSSTQDSSSGGTYAINLSNKRSTNTWSPSGTSFNSNETVIYGWDAGGLTKGNKC